MRLIRSLAICALAICASAVMMIPASASVPIDPGIHVMAPSLEAHPAPVAEAVDRAALTCEAPAATFRDFTRSLPSGAGFLFASADGSRSSFIDVRRRC